MGLTQHTFPSPRDPSFSPLSPHSFPLRGMCASAAPAPPEGVCSHEKKRRRSSRLPISVLIVVPIHAQCKQSTYRCYDYLLAQ